MKIATVGKGGAGKTTIAGTLARVLADRGASVLAIDGDPNPNLALMLGVEQERIEGIPFIPPNIMRVQEDSDGTRRLEMTRPESELLEHYGVGAPDDIKLIVMGHPADGSAGSGCMCASHRAVRGLIAEMTAFGEHTITDMEAGLEHLKRGTARNVDIMLVVTEPYYRSLEAAARTCRLARELEVPYIFVVANKVASEADGQAIEAFCKRHDMPIIATVPADTRFVEAERASMAPIDFDRNSPGVQAIRGLADRLTDITASAEAPRADATGSRVSADN